MLTVTQIEDRIKTPISDKDLIEGVEVQNKHKVHITGEGFTLTQLKGFESKQDFDIRTQLTEPATVQLCALILDNLNRWVTSQGTVKVIKFKQEEQAKAFKEVLNQVWRGSSLEEFIRTFYKEAIYQEMSGFLLITKPILDGGMQIREGVEQRYEGGALNPYMIFIAAEDVHDFNAVGDDIEYIIIKLGDKDGKVIYRVLDDTQDITVLYDKSNESIESFDEAYHGLDYTPVIQVSNILKHLRNDKVKTSAIDHVLSALDRYAQKDSDLIIQMVRHMYPKLASVTTVCKLCDGNGYNYPTTGDVDTRVKCSSCNGTGKVIPISRDGIIGLPQFIDEGKTPYPGSPASYITPDNASLTVAIDDLKDLAKNIMYSATGDKNLIAESLNTATENLINYKGLEDRISEIVAMVESREEFIITTVAKMHLDFTNAFDGVSVRYGRKMAIRGESEILEELTKSKDAGMPISHIEALQRELIYSRYKNNKTELERQQLLADLEPLNGYTTKEIADISEYVSKEDLRLKYNFNTVLDWFESVHGAIQDYHKEQDWKKRVEDIRQILLTNEILHIEEPGDGDGIEIIPASPEE